MNCRERCASGSNRCPPGKRGVCANRSKICPCVGSRCQQSWEWTLKGERIIKSKGASLAGYSDEEVIGKLGLGLLVINSIDHIPKLYDPLRPDKTVFHQTLTIRTKDGGVIVVDNVREAIIRNGECIGYAGITMPVQPCNECLNCKSGKQKTPAE